MTNLNHAESRIGRDELVAAVTKFVANRDRRSIVAIRSSVEREIDEAGPAAMSDLSERLTTAGADWNFYQRDPLARRIHHVLAGTVLEPGSALLGVEHAVAVEGAPVVIVANHLSYSDANLLDVLLYQSGGGAGLADRMTVIAGPKVYSSVKRRFSSLCFGTIKTPQSSGISSEDAVMNAREVARAARRCIDIAHERLRLGEALLVFAEGRRSRTTAMQPLLAGAARYLDVEKVRILPAAITGTETMFPIGEETLHSVRAVARLGPSIDAQSLRDRAGDNRQLMMDVVGLAIAALLPPEYRGAYADTGPALDEARTLARSIAAVP